MSLSVIMAVERPGATSNRGLWRVTGVWSEGGQTLKLGVRHRDAASYREMTSSNLY